MLVEASVGGWQFADRLQGELRRGLLLGNEGCRRQLELAYLSADDGSGSGGAGQEAEPDLLVALGARVEHHLGDGARAPRLLEPPDHHLRRVPRVIWMTLAASGPNMGGRERGLAHRALAAGPGLGAVLDIEAEGALRALRQLGVS